MIVMHTPVLENHREEMRVGLTPEQIRRNHGIELIRTEDIQPSRPGLKLTVLRLGVIDE